MFALNQHLCVLVFIIGIFTPNEATNQCMPSITFFHTKDMVIDGHIIATVKVRSREWCEHHCLWEPRCRSINYQIDSTVENRERVCELSSSTIQRHPRLMKKRPGWLYGEVQILDKNNLQRDIDDCSPNPCQNGGTCTDRVYSYQCACKQGYSGTNCETDIDDCSPNPCQNGGTCTVGVDSYKCACKQDYNGTMCEIAIGINIAYNKPTAQSSTHSDANSSRAVDNNTYGDYFSGSCAATLHNTSGAWWRVDLSSSMQVSRVVIYNRVDCCSDRLDNFDIRVGDSLKNNGNSNTICAAAQSLAHLTMKEIHCTTALRGRYLNIQLPGKNSLTLCEVKVFSL